jgi:Transposase DDE domain
MSGDVHVRFCESLGLQRPGPLTKGREIYARRKAIVEPVFGQIGTVQDGRRVLIRGKPAARAQWRFECAIHNLLKLHRNGGLAALNTS